MLNPVWLKTFITLVDTRHFTQTAEKLNMTQPGVSQHISKLETACGHSLIKRENKSFSITEQGQMVYHHAKALISNEKLLFEKLSFDDPLTGDCTLACSGSVALLLYPKLLKLQCKHPNIHVHIRAAPNYQILSDIKSGVIDQGIVTDKPNEIFFDFEKIGREELCFVYPKNTDSSTIYDLFGLGLGFISHPDAEHYLSLYIKHSKDKSLNSLDISKIPIISSINQISQILEPVAQGIGFTILPRSAVDSFHNPESLNTFRPKNPVMESLYLVRKKSRLLPARYNEFNSIIRKAWA